MPDENAKYFLTLFILTDVRENTSTYRLHIIINLTGKIIKKCYDLSRSVFLVKETDTQPYRLAWFFIRSRYFYFIIVSFTMEVKICLPKYPKQAKIVHDIHQKNNLNHLSNIHSAFCDSVDYVKQEMHAGVKCHCHEFSK